MHFLTRRPLAGIEEVQVALRHACDAVSIARAQYAVADETLPSKPSKAKTNSASPRAGRYSRSETHSRTDSSALGSALLSVPPACAMSGRPPPLPPTWPAT